MKQILKAALIVLAFLLVIALWSVSPDGCEEMEHCPSDLLQMR